ncbi:Hypothetical predicted protein [Pelobates cultripes]|uniref:Uncharacterized protein n=1 Tax=Pelobates cultripes TaxID=61616 RepID=A0AAD1RH58_PELCU|nr:Hypothetical predicted protein [Pelobates cultripes]
MAALEELQDGAEEDASELQRPPQSEAPVTQGILQSMLDRMHDKLQHTFQSALKEIRADIQDLGARTSTLEDQMADQTESLFKVLAPDLPQDLLLLDRYHRVQKPKFLTTDAPRDVLVCLHYFHVKEDIMRASRQRQSLPEPHQRTTIYADISAATLKKSKTFAAITEQLRQHKKPYRWGFPVKLLISHEGTITAIHTPEAGLKALQDWGILPPTTTATATDRSGVTPTWRKLPRRR